MPYIPQLISHQLPKCGAARAELKRWDRIRWVRELSSAIVSDGTGAAAQAAKFARSARVKSEEYQQRYRLKCRQIFEKQVRRVTTA